MILISLPHGDERTDGLRKQAIVAGLCRAWFIAWT